MTTHVRDENPAGSDTHGGEVIYLPVRRSRWKVYSLLLEAVSGWLRCESIGLAEWGGGDMSATTTTGGAGSDHEPVATEDGRVVVGLLLFLLASVPGLVVRLESGEFLGLLAEEVDHVRHGEVV